MPKGVVRLRVVVVCGTVALYVRLVSGSHVGANGRQAGATIAGRGMALPRVLAMWVRENP
jgi:hypothetical protein